MQGAALIRARAADWIYGEEGEDLAAVVLARMRGLGLRLAVAESCTGGALGARLTEIPGSSDVFLGGVIAYHNRIKEALLGVPPALLSEQGAVSEPVARAMAVGVARNLEADVAVAITGIAGPGGGTPEKSVGLVFLAVARGEQVRVTRHHFPGDRGEIRARAAQVALYRLLRTLEGSES
jgi:nicotinamide-nucleotide amidase